MESKKVLLFGLGFFQRTLLRMLIENRPCIVVDIDKDLAERAQNEYADVTAVEGEASSIVTWKKINIEDISHIVSSLQDYDVVLEICRIARNVYKLQIPIILMLYKNDRREELEQYDVKIINPLLIAAESGLNIIQKNYANPNNIGLGKGEIVEVMIRRRSHMVDRKMRFLAPNRWRVAAAYRDGHLIVPDGDFKLQIGDKAVLVGDPKVVENIVNILMIGKPEFPLQYGQTLAVLADKIQADDELEMNYFHGNTKAKKYLWYDTEKSSTRTKPFTENLEKEGCVFG
ncbi:MAG: NAD-binding protein, partial [Mucispirillum sp.]|nr:NAD-binding protein [Mucispirillum sp.]